MYWLVTVLISSIVKKELGCEKNIMISFAEATDINTEVAILCTRLWLVRRDPIVFWK
jgi:hypothetical protein